MDYWDSSALLKLYVTEHDSGYFLDLIAKSGRPISTSAIAVTEALCALHRKERAGLLKSGGADTLFRRFLADCEKGRAVLIPYGLNIAVEAEKLMKLALERQPVMIRSLDLIHLASASLSKAKSFVATDKRLREFATLLGFQLWP